MRFGSSSHQNVLTKSLNPKKPTCVVSPLLGQTEEGLRGLTIDTGHGWYTKILQTSHRVLGEVSGVLRMGGGGEVSWLGCTCVLVRSPNGEKNMYASCNRQSSGQ